jgi:hypothetical protein
MMFSVAGNRLLVLHCDLLPRRIQRAGLRAVLRAQCSEPDVSITSVALGNLSLSCPGAAALALRPSVMDGLVVRAALDGLIDGLVAALCGLRAALMGSRRCLDGLVAALEDGLVAALDGLVAALDGLVAALNDGLVAAFDGLVAAFDGFVAAFDGLVAAFDGLRAACVFDGLVTAFEGLVAAFDCLVAAFDTIMPYNALYSYRAYDVLWQCCLFDPYGTNGYVAFLPLAFFIAPFIAKFKGSITTRPMPY